MKNIIRQLISGMFFTVICHIVPVTLCIFKAALCILENPEKIAMELVWMFTCTTEC